MPTFPIKGIPLPASGTLPKRREIDAWWKDPECAAQLSLFVKALAAFKKLDPVDPTLGMLSYFQIAGQSNSELALLTLSDLSRNSWTA